MSRITINGPIIPKDAKNVILVDALFHSPSVRLASRTDHHIVEVGIREGENVSIIGTWSQKTQAIDAATPTSILDAGRSPMRLRAGQAIVIRVTSEGTPASLEGCSVNLRRRRVGGRDGTARSLVPDVATARDPNARASLAILERQINTGGLADVEDVIQLHDPVVLAGTAAFHGRIQVDSTTQISLQRYIGNWVEVDGEPVSISVDGLVCKMTDALLESTGTVGSSTPQSDILYKVYVGSINGFPLLRLSTTAPSAYLGTYYLGTDPGPRRWRFAGWVYVNSDTEFTDSVTSRLCCNYYNRLVKELYLAPVYTDNDTTDTSPETSTAWARMASGTNSRVVFLSNAEDACVLHGTASAKNDTAGATTEMGLGIDTIGGPQRAGVQSGTEIGNIAVHHSEVLAVGYHTADILVRVSAGIGTFYGDRSREGADADSAATYISGQVLV